MGSFAFNVNRSFLEDKSHPITVPKAQYPALKAEGFSSGTNLTIFFPHGERFAGHLYSSRGGYGWYYQLRLRGKGSAPFPDYLKDGDGLFVALAKVGRLRL